MKIFSAEQIRRWDAFTIDNEPISSIDLMERAAFAVAKWVINSFDYTHSISIVCGPGNNGGDGLAIARILASFNYQVKIFTLEFSESKSQDYTTNFNRLKANIKIIPVHPNKLPIELNSDIFIDCIFGSGLNKAPYGLSKEMITMINNATGIKLSIDIASGLSCDKPILDFVAVQPDYTLTFQSPKLSFFFPENERFVGKVIILPIGLLPQFEEKEPSTCHYLEEELQSPSLTKYTHKGTQGHVLIIGGSLGKSGAVHLASRAALKTGSGLVTAHVPQQAIIPLQSNAPEIMVSTDEDPAECTSLPSTKDFTAIGIGPGFGTSKRNRNLLEKLLKSASQSMVIDADALNIIANNSHLLPLLEGHILTPHLKEFERLTRPVDNHYDRLLLLRQFSQEHKVTTILKGAHTAICTEDGTITFNSTGNPGMATAGSGDVLTGIITSLIGQGLSNELAAKTGVYLHGLAGDKMVQQQTQASLTAMNIIQGLERL